MTRKMKRRLNNESEEGHEEGSSENENVKVAKTLLSLANFGESSPNQFDESSPNQFDDESSPNQFDDGIAEFLCAQLRTKRGDVKSINVKVVFKNGQARTVKWMNEFKSIELQ